jgi:hypothetical protein
VENDPNTSLESEQNKCDCRMASATAPVACRHGDFCVAGGGSFIYRGQLIADWAEQTVNYGLVSQLVKNRLIANWLDGL